MHTATIVQQFLVKKKGFSAQPPCVPSQSKSSELLCIPQIKNGTKSRLVQQYFGCQKSMMAKLKAISFHKWEKVMKRYKDPAEECIRANINYFE